MTIVAAMGQMFYSLSIAMGILYTYGSYTDKDMDLEQSTTQIEIFDTGIAILAGLMIIPAVFSFSGGNPENLQADHPSCLLLYQKYLPVWESVPQLVSCSLYSCCWQLLQVQYL